MHEKSNTKKVRLSLIGASGKMGQMISELASKDPELEIVDDGDVVIDFSSPEGTKKAIAMGKPLVCGTTGLSEEIFRDLQKLAKEVPVLYSPNFSLGIALCFEMLDQMAEKLKKFSKISIKEIHHTQKVDSPSGTAKRLGELLETENITAERIGDVIGVHQVNFLFDEEELILKHEVFSRKAFAHGAIVAAKYLFNRPAKYYKLSDVFC